MAAAVEVCNLSSCNKFISKLYTSMGLGTCGADAKDSCICVYWNTSCCLDLILLQYWLDFVFGLQASLQVQMNTRLEAAASKNREMAGRRLRLVGWGELGGVVEGVNGAGVGQVVVQVLDRALQEHRTTRDCQTQLTQSADTREACDTGKTSFAPPYFVSKKMRHKHQSRHTRTLPVTIACT